MSSLRIAEILIPPSFQVSGGKDREQILPAGHNGSLRRKTRAT